MEGDLYEIRTRPISLNHYVLLNLDHQGALSKQSTKVVSPLDYWGKIACWYKNMTNTNIGHVVYDMMHPQNIVLVKIFNDISFILLINITKRTFSIFSYIYLNLTTKRDKRGNRQSALVIDRIPILQYLKISIFERHW